MPWTVGQDAPVLQMPVPSVGCPVLRGTASEHSACGMVNKIPTLLFKNIIGVLSKGSLNGSALVLHHPTSNLSFCYA